MTQKVALMSIRPQYAEKILSGEKTIELRRQRPQLRNGDLVMVYVTSPASRLAGAFRVDDVLSLPVRSMWRRYRPVLGVDHETYESYFEDRELAHGISIAEAWSSSDPVSLEELRRRFEGFVPPQSYMYWPDRWSIPTSLRDAARRLHG